MTLIDCILDDEETDPVSELEILDGYDFYTSDIIDAFIGRTSDRKRADAVSVLMDIKRKRFVPSRKSKYEL